MDLDAINTRQPDGVLALVPFGERKAPQTMSILVVDNEPVIVQGLKQILAAAFPSMTFSQAENSRKVVDLLRQRPWALVVLVCGSPGTNALAVLKMIRRTSPEVPVLVMGSYSKGECALCAIKAGASGCVTKKATPEELVQAIRKVTSEGCYINSAIDQEIVDTQGQVSDLPPHELFSGREFQVLVMVLAGKSLKEIAFELVCSVKTISTYHTRIFRKLKITSDVELARYAIARGMVCGQSPSVLSPSRCPLH